MNRARVDGRELLDRKAGEARWSTTDFVQGFNQDHRGQSSERVLVLTVEVIRQGTLVIMSGVVWKLSTALFTQDHPLDKWLFHWMNACVILGLSVLMSAGVVWKKWNALPTQMLDPWRVPCLPVTVSATRVTLVGSSMRAAGLCR